MTHNIPTAAHCPICGAVLMNASLHMAHYLDETMNIYDNRSR